MAHRKMARGAASAKPPEVCRKHRESLAAYHQHQELPEESANERRAGFLDLSLRFLGRFGSGEWIAGRRRCTAQGLVPCDLPVDVSHAQRQWKILGEKCKPNFGREIDETLFRSSVLEIRFSMMGV